MCCNVIKVYVAFTMLLLKYMWRLQCCWKTYMWSLQCCWKSICDVYNVVEKVYVGFTMLLLKYMWRLQCCWKSICGVWSAEMWVFITVTMFYTSLCDKETIKSLKNDDYIVFTIWVGNIIWRWHYRIHIST